MPRQIATGTTVLDLRGPLRLWRDQTEVALRPKERAVLAALALERRRPVEPDRIAALVWEHDPPATARKSIHNHIARLRQAAEGVIVTSSSGYALADHVELVPWSRGSGEPFADLADTPEVTFARNRALAEVDAEADAALEQAVRGDADDALARLHQATEALPLDERRWWLLAFQLARRGRRRDALLTFQEARRQLAEAGLMLGEQLRALEGLIVADDPSLHDPHGQRRLLNATLGPTPSPPSPASPAPLPPIHPHHADPFVGRQRELDQLAAAWDDVVATGRPGLVLIEAPAGMGKTRLADRFVRGVHGHAPGARVVLGRGRSAADPAFATLTESFEGLLTTSLAEPEDQLVQLRLVQSVRARLGELLTAPTIWCIDDLQWVSADTLLVIEAALDGLRGPLLLLVTVRAGERRPSESLAVIERSLATCRIDLDPLSVDELSSLFTDAGPELAEAVYSRTGGLPLYASEIARATRRAPLDVADVPAALHDWVGARQAGLAPEAAATLDAAAVLGEHFDSDLLSEVMAHLDGSPPAATARNCDRLVAVGLLHADAGLQNLTELSFAHAITHEIVYGRIGPTLRAHLHLAAAEALQRHAARLGVEPDHAALTHHYELAGTPGRGPAARESRLAGDDAYRNGAWGRAATHYRTAARLAADEPARAELLVALGRAELRAGHHAAAAESLGAAIDLARVHGLAPTQARATRELVGRAGRGATIGAPDAAHAELLRAAIGALARYRPTSPDDARSAAVALSALERELAFVLLLDGDATERSRLLGDSLARARAIDPPDHDAVAAAVLGARYAKLAPHRLGERLADIDEVLTAPRDEVGYENVLAASCYRIEDLLRAGCLDAAGAAIADAELILRQHPHSYWQWAVRAWQAVFAVVRGDLDEAEALAYHAAALRPDVPETSACLAVNLINIGMYRGHAPQLVAMLEAGAAAYPNVPAYRAVLAFCLARTPSPDAQRRAAHELAAFAATGFTNLPDDTNRFFGLAMLGHAAADLGDIVASKELIELLDPYRGQWVVVMAYGGGGAVWGPADHALARLADTVGDSDRARDLYAAAEQQAAGAPHALALIAADRFAARG